MKTLQAELLVDGFSFGEGPRWHDDRLWFTDIAEGAVKTVDADGCVDIAVVLEHPSGLGWLPDGSMVVSALYEATIRRVGAEGVSVYCDLSNRAWSTNDMVVAPDGRIYVDLYERTADGIKGQIALVTPRGEIHIVATDLATPNGLGITPDGSTLVVSETFSGRVLAFAIEADGTLGDRRVFADLGEARHPDGLCVDAEGAVWIGCYDTGEFVRVLDGGEITHRIETHGPWAVAPALGGPDRRTLYLVINETTHGGLARGESTGRIDVVEVDVPGAGWP